MAAVRSEETGADGDAAPVLHRRRARHDGGSPLAGLLLSILAVGLLVSSCPPPRLEIETYVGIESAGGETLAEIRLPDGCFDHHFVHSFHLTPVDERFKVENDGSLRLYELRYASTGVGMPTEAEGGYRLEGGRFVLSMDRRFEKIPIMVSIVPGHGLVVGGRLLPFTDWAEPEDLVIVKGRASTIFK
jgi:hypothetical protein